LFKASLSRNLLIQIVVECIATESAIICSEMNYKIVWWQQTTLMFPEYVGVKKILGLQPSITTRLASANNCSQKIVMFVVVVGHFTQSLLLILTQEC
jgi:hypothetical protein